MSRFVCRRRLNVEKIQLLVFLSVIVVYDQTKRSSAKKERKKKVEKYQQNHPKTDEARIDTQRCHVRCVAGCTPIFLSSCFQIIFSAFFPVGFITVTRIEMHFSNLAIFSTLQSYIKHKIAIFGTAQFYHSRV